MKILFQTRKTIYTVPGGDTTQLVKTKEHLEYLGVHVDVSTELEVDLGGYDLVHLFNLMRPQEVYLQARNAVRQGKRIVLSTIYADFTEYELRARTGLTGLLARHVSSWQMEQLKVIARAFVNREMSKGSLFASVLGYRNLCNQVAEMTNVFLPNSASEMRRVHNDFAVTRSKPYIVVPNAADTAVFDSKLVASGDSAMKYAGCVLSVARIQGCKCQLELVRAMRDLPYQLVLIGKPAPNHLSYLDAVKREAGDRVHILGQIPHEELAQYYKAAKVHALISWMETTGLSSLEAGAMGCNLVITAKGDTRDYFGDDAYYCEPDSVESIREAIVRAYNAPVNPALSRRIREEYNWQMTAKKTLEGYQLALA